MISHADRFGATWWGRHLQRARDQTAEHPDRHRTGRRVAVQVPQARMQEGGREGPQPAVLADAAVVGKKAFEELAHGVGPGARV